MMSQLPLIKEKGVLRLSGISSGQILDLLRLKHTKDVFIDECKNGETWGARDLLKLDAWVLLRTYSPLTTIGYEIKTSRADFEQDQKWVKYLDLCHLFYFVCPAGLIRSTDIPSGVGLMWVSSTGKLHTKKKAESQNPDIEKQSRLLIYALMSRAKIVANMYDVNRVEPVGRLQELRHTVEQAKERKELAYFIKGHIREIVAESTKIDMELKYREESIKRFEERLSILGINWDSEKSTWEDTMRVNNEIDLLKKRIDIFTLDNMRRVGKQLTEVAEAIRELRK